MHSPQPYPIGTIPKGSYPKEMGATKCPTEGTGVWGCGLCVKATQRPRGCGEEAIRVFQPTLREECNCSMIKGGGSISAPRASPLGEAELGEAEEAPGSTSFPETGSWVRC